MSNSNGCLFVCFGWWVCNHIHMGVSRSTMKLENRKCECPDLDKLQMSLSLGKNGERSAMDL